MARANNDRLHFVKVRAHFFYETAGNWPRFPRFRVYLYQCSIIQLDELCPIYVPISQPNLANLNLYRTTR